MQSSHFSHQIFVHGSEKSTSRSPDDKQIGMHTAHSRSLLKHTRLISQDQNYLTTTKLVQYSGFEARNQDPEDNLKWVYLIEEW